MYTRQVKVTYLLNINVDKCCERYFKLKPYKTYNNQQLGKDICYYESSEMSQLVGILCCTQCVWLPDTSCPTGTDRSFQSGAATITWMIQPSMTQWCALPGHGSALLRRSRWSPICTAGHTSCSCPMTRLARSVGTEAVLLSVSSATMKTTRLLGSDSVLIQQPRRSMRSLIKYKHSPEVFLSHYLLVYLHPDNIIECRAVIGSRFPSLFIIRKYRIFHQL